MNNNLEREQQNQFSKAVHGGDLDGGLKEIIKFQTQSSYFELVVEPTNSISEETYKNNLESNFIQRIIQEIAQIYDGQYRVVYFRLNNKMQLVEDEGYSLKKNQIEQKLQEHSQLFKKIDENTSQDINIDTNKHFHNILTSEIFYSKKAPNLQKQYEKIVELEKYSEMQNRSQEIISIYQDVDKIKSIFHTVHTVLKKERKEKQELPSYLEELYQILFSFLSEDEHFLFGPDDSVDQSSGNNSIDDTLENDSITKTPDDKNRQKSNSSDLTDKQQITECIKDSYLLKENKALNDQLLNEKQSVSKLSEEIQVLNFQISGLMARINSLLKDNHFLRRRQYVSDNLNENKIRDLKGEI